MDNEPKGMFGLTPFSCDCDKGVGMCKGRPCWATPRQIRALIDSGVDPQKLWLDYFIAERGERVYIVSPAAVGKEMTIPDYPAGRCVFLTGDNKCALHGKNKPIEGALSCCMRVVQKHPLEIHAMVANTWDTKEGRKVVAYWKQLIGGEHALR